MEHPLTMPCDGAMDPPAEDPMSVHKQVFWLRGHPNHQAFPSLRTVAFSGFRLSLQRRHRVGFSPTYLFSALIERGTYTQQIYDIIRYFT